MNIIPNVELVNNRLEGKVSLPVWKDFQVGQPAYGAQNSSGECWISIGGDMVVTNPTITVEHVNAYNHLTTHSAKICKSILTRLLSEYKNLKTGYGYGERTAKEIMPDVDNIEQFKALIGLSRVHLLNVSNDNIAYVGYEFNCSWDDEHGLGVMTHKDRIVNLGGADTSFLNWVARKDLNI